MRDRYFWPLFILALFATFLALIVLFVHLGWFAPIDWGRE